MDDILLLEAIERYLNGQMTGQEKMDFESFRKSTPEVDQMVVEHNMFLHQMNHYTANCQLKQNLQNTHTHLIEIGAINEGQELTTKGKLIQIWNKYKRVTAIAASVGGVIALVISGIVLSFSPVVHNNQIQELSKAIEVIQQKQKYQGSLINEVKSKIPENAKLISGGSGFLIDGKGYLITNAHVLKGTGVVVVNSKGLELNANIAFVDESKDLAILKIVDQEYEASKNLLPYGIKKSGTDLGERIFTLGYPKNDIVYGEGYLSGRTGYNADSLTYQIQISANPGNSGGPVFNNNGEVIGILSTRQAESEGVSFAIKSKHIHQLVEKLKKEEEAFEKIKLPSKSYLRGMDRKEQINKIESFVYFVKSFKK